MLHKEFFSKNLLWVWKVQQQTPQFFPLPSSFPNLVVVNTTKREHHNLLYPRRIQKRNEKMENLIFKNYTKENVYSLMWRT